MAQGASVRQVSAKENSCAHHVTWSPNKLWRSSYIFNPWPILLAQGASLRQYYWRRVHRCANTIGAGCIGAPILLAQGTLVRQYYWRRVHWCANCLKVVGNEKVGGSGMCQSVPIWLGPRWSRFFCLFNFAVVFDFTYFRFRPSKAKSIGNVLTNRQNPTNCCLRGQLKKSA